MDKKVNQLPVATTPLSLTDDLFIVAKLPNPGEAYYIDFGTLVTQILLASTNNGSKLYYVDANSTVVGDGSVLKPFQTLDEARSAIIGTGTQSAPQFTNVGVMVASASYTTALNLWITNTSWIFADGAIVVYTGTGHLFDSSVYPNELSGRFIVAGGAIFRTNTGGIVRNEGGVTSTNFVDNKVFLIEAYQMISTKISANPDDTPLILHNRITGTGYSPISTYIQIRRNGTISSYNQHCVHVINGGTFSLSSEEGGENYLIYGLNSITGAYTGGVVGGRCVLYENTDATTRKYYATCNIANFNVIGINCLSEIHIEGNFNNIELRNLSFTDAGPIPTHPTYCITIGDITAVYNINAYFIFLIKNCRVLRNPCTDPNLIFFVGATTTDLVEIQNCIFMNGYFVDPNIFIGANSNFNQPISCVNIFNGLLNMANIPVYNDNADAVANGLLPGDIYNISVSGANQLAIVV